MPLDDAVDREGPAERPAVVKSMDEVDDIVEPLGERCRFEMMTVDQFGHQRADALQHAQHRGPDAEFGGALRGLGLVGAIDAEQLGAFARDADDVLPMVRRGDEVSVGDAAAEWTNLRRSGQRTDCSRARAVPRLPSRSHPTV